jgi:hypothetical protein
MAGDSFYCKGSPIYAEDVFAGARQDPKIASTFLPKLADNGGSSCDIGAFESGKSATRIGLGCSGS